MRDEYIRSIIAANHRIKHEVGSRLANIPGKPITPVEWSILSIIQHSGKVNTKLLAQKLHVTQSAISQTLKSMEKRGIISRQIDPDDRRSTRIQLTPRSQKTLISIEKSVSACMSELFTVLSDQELKTFAELNTKISDSLQHLYEKN